MSALPAPETFGKLRESQYFLERMGVTQSGEPFPYYVSAFLGATRSVKDILKREVSRFSILDWTGRCVHAERKRRAELAERRRQELRRRLAEERDNRH